MKKTGMIRRVDAVGRVVIPRELQRILSLNKPNEVEMYVVQDQLVIKKRNKTCFVTGEPIKYPYIFLKGKLLLSAKGAEILAKEIEAYQQTKSKSSTIDNPM
ncbi:AbrB/MazE/SpoVT family DNA-binding domain-containing protein [Bacillus cereus]